MRVDQGLSKAPCTIAVDQLTGCHKALAVLPVTISVCFFVIKALWVKVLWKWWANNFLFGAFAIHSVKGHRCCIVNHSLLIPRPTYRSSGACWMNPYPASQPIKRYPFGRPSGTSRGVAGFPPVWDGDMRLDGAWLAHHMESVLLDEMTIPEFQAVYSRLSQTQSACGRLSIVSLFQTSFLAQEVCPHGSSGWHRAWKGEGA